MATIDKTDYKNLNPCSAHPINRLIIKLCEHIQTVTAAARMQYRH